MLLLTLSLLATVHVVRSLYSNVHLHYTVAYATLLTFTAGLLGAVFWFEPVYNTLASIDSYCSLLVEIYLFALYHPDFPSVAMADLDAEICRLDSEKRTMSTQLEELRSSAEQTKIDARDTAKRDNDISAAAAGLIEIEAILRRASVLDQKASVVSEQATVIQIQRESVHGYVVRVSLHFFLR